MKKCRICLIEKEINDFPKTGRRCKKCLSEYKKEYKEKNKDLLREKNKKYYQDNREKILNYSKDFHEKNKEYYKEYRRENKDKIRNNYKNWVELNSEHLKEYSKNWREENNEYLTQYKKEYYKENKEEINDKSRKYYQENKDSINISRTEYQKNYRTENKDKIKERNSKWRQKNSGYAKEYMSERSKIDKLFFLKTRIRCLIKNSFSFKGYKKNTKTEKILGCSFMEFKLHIESKFETWMNWENYGLYNGEDNYGWDLDHIIPLSSAKSEEEVIQLNHYTNLQPLCSKVNRFIKKDNF